jgi:multiple sugar transport system substrate-binding protein/putative aldouronate transport system substrate-binding protein
MRLRYALPAFITTAALTLAACSSDGGGGSSGDDTDPSTQMQGAMENYEAGDQFTATEPLTFSILWTEWPELPIKDSWEFFDVLEERTNVSLDTTVIPLSDHDEKRSLLISAGDAPQIIPLVYSGEDRQFAASRAVLPVSDYLEYMPHFTKLIDEWDLEELLDTLRQDDGKLYMLPGLLEVSVPMFTLLVRKDKFDELGIDMPDTWEGFHEAFLELKDAYPDSYPLQDGFEGKSLINYAARAFGTQAGWGYGNHMQWDEGAGQFEYAGTSDEYREMVEFFHGLVEDGLLDPEAFTTTTEGVERVEREIANEKSFAGSGGSGTLLEWSVALDESVGDGNYELVQVPPPAGPAGPVIEPRGFWHGFMITADARNSPDLIALIQFLDWLYYSPEAREFLRWGVEGEQYTKDADGTITLEPDYTWRDRKINPSGSIDIARDLGYSGFLAESTESLELRSSYDSDQAIDYIEQVLETRTPLPPPPPAPLDEAELEQSALLATALNDSVEANTLRFILGERPLSEWDSYIAELEAQGLQTYIDLINGAQQRFAESN